MRFGIVTLFPEMFDAITDNGVVGRAIRQGVLSLQCSNPRDFTDDKHRTVDDRPYGGGPGMLMKVEPLERAINAMRKSYPAAKVVYMSPQGKRFDQAAAQTFSECEELIVLAGRYEGVDERLLRAQVDEEWSVGDYVLSGGELPAMIMIDAIARLLPGVLGHPDSAVEDSFVDGLLDCPHYTRPEVYKDEAVPEVLMSGDHARIKTWRLQQALGRTYLRRPDMLEQRGMSRAEEDLLADFLAQQDSGEY
jgi:tRNA (guanine37-N1)-methyltransferase